MNSLPPKLNFFVTVTSLFECRIVDYLNPLLGGEVFHSLLVVDVLCYPVTLSFRNFGPQILVEVGIRRVFTALRLFSNLACR